MSVCTGATLLDYLKGLGLNFNKDITQVDIYMLGQGVPVLVEQTTGPFSNPFSEPESMVIVDKNGRRLLSEEMYDMIKGVAELSSRGLAMRSHISIAVDEVVTVTTESVLPSNALDFLKDYKLAAEY